MGLEQVTRPKILQAICLLLLVVVVVVMLSSLVGFQRVQVNDQAFLIHFSAKNFQTVQHVVKYCCCLYESVPG